MFTTEAPGPCQPGCDPGETEMITKGPPSTETFEAQVPILCGNWETACLSRQPCQSHQPALLAPLCLRLPVRAQGLQRPYKDLERRHRPDTASPPSPLRWPDAACVVTASVRVAGPRAHSRRHPCHSQCCGSVMSGPYSCVSVLFTLPNTSGGKN